MGRTLAIIAIVVAVPVAAILIYAATRPDSFRVERTVRIAAPPETIYPFVSDFRKFTAWSPYEKKDPAMTRSFSGPASGAGAAYAWQGDKNVGSGRMEIVDTAPPSAVAIRLDFVKPFEAHNIVDFTLKPDGDGTTAVTWAMHGPTPYFAKIVHLFFDMDRMVGKDFETGLADLKAVAETQAAGAASVR